MVSRLVLAHAMRRLIHGPTTSNPVRATCTLLWSCSGSSKTRSGAGVGSRIGEFARFSFGLFTWFLLAQV